jgi:putative hemolysin
MNDIGLQLLVILGLTVLNGFFSAAEIAILAVRKTRLRELADDGRRAAKLALKLRDDPERFLATVQVGITVLGATAGAFGGSVLEAPIGALLRHIGFGAAAGHLAFALVVALVSVLSVVVGELVPKSIALRSSERIALAMSGPLYQLSRLARPVIWFLTASSNLLLRPLRDSTTFIEARLSPDELQQLVGEAAQAGTVDKETGEIASRAIDLATLEAFSVMVPRTQIVWLSVCASVEEAKRMMQAKPHARYPVADEAREPLGYVVAHDVYAQLLEGRVDLRSIVQEIPTFPERAAAVDVLRVLQRSRSEIGLILDETGGSAGLVSIEALAEELFGDILGEREAGIKRITPAGQSTFVVRGETPVHELNRELGLELPIEPSASTLAGLVLAAAGRFPERSAWVTLADGVLAEVLETRARRVVLVKLHLHPPSPPPDAPQGIDLQQRNPRW